MKRFILPMFLLLLTFIACNSAGEESPENINEVEIGETHNQESAKAVELQKSNTGKEIEQLVGSDADIVVPNVKLKSGKPDPAQTLATVNSDWHKKIIKNANIRLEVKKHDEYSYGVRNTIERFGGYIAKEDNYNSEDKSETVLIVKVPVASFEQLLSELHAKDAKLLERNISTEDVTSQMIDTKARLETRKATREKYMEFLKQSKTVEDILRVQSAINDIQEDIESAETRLAFLSNETKFSTINITFFEPKNGYSYNHKPSYGNRIIDAFVNGGRWFADLFIGLLSIWPLYLFGFIGFLIYRRLKKPWVKKFE